MLARLALATVGLANLASAWWISFYTGELCDQDASFNYVNYWGKYQSNCVYVGEDENNCGWYTDNGQTKNRCTAPMLDPRPSSYLYADDTKCDIYMGSTCEADTIVQVGPGQCGQISYPDGYTGGVSISCNQA
ncbi:Hypothetical predicted protein [Lecanosticta acicola]|uniref:Uncharacterized protein n=1 Tax=Lecanosticta acicola TaxID=111012 RepID=A0AAI8Z237_9PEZI|nr:Hypothetical predicted protein [Lecanosticta acicola]